MKIYKITEASDYLGVSINTLKTLANNGKIKSFKTTAVERRKIKLKIYQSNLMEFEKEDICY
jgi:excisionase family DNA binding protein